MIIEFRDVGPELLLSENIPIDEININLKAIRLGIYLSLVVGQGKGEEYPGLYGPLPWNETPNHNLVLFAFKANDPTVKDPRTVKTGVMTYLVIFFPREENHLLQTRLSLEQSLDRILNPIEDKERIILTYESALLVLAQIKIIVWKSITEGEKLLQEQALETIMNDNRVLYVSLHDLHDNSTFVSIKGESENYISFIDQIRQLLDSEISFSATLHQSQKLGLIKFPEHQKVLFTVFEQTFDRSSFIYFVNSILSAMPLLEYYYFS